jgi:membrane-associated HD superfamily phosphohydrolase
MKNNTCFNTYTLISKVLNTPYNWSLALITVIIWTFSGNWFSYSTNQNFDMLVYSQDCIKLLSLSVIIFGLFKKQSNETEEKDNVLKLGIITYILSLFTVLSIKSISYSLWLGIWVFQPLSIFLFLMIIQQIWKIASK